jgi:hypothetical protein
MNMLIRFAKNELRKCGVLKKYISSILFRVVIIAPAAVVVVELPCLGRCVHYLQV